MVSAHSFVAHPIVKSLDLPDELLREIAKHIRDGLTVANFSQLHRRSHDATCDIVHEAVRLTIARTDEEVRFMKLLWRAARLNFGHRITGAGMRLY